MDTELDLDSLRCEICDQSLTQKISPSYWWEYLDDETDALIVICQQCGNDLKPAERRVRLEKFHKHYWTLWSSIFNRDNAIMFLFTVGILALIIFLAILFLRFHPYDYGYCS